MNVKSSCNLREPSFEALLCMVTRCHVLAVPGVVAAPVGQEAPGHPGDGEHHDEAGAGQQLVVPALARVAPAAPRPALALRLQHSAYSRSPYVSHTDSKKSKNNSIS